MGACAGGRKLLACGCTSLLVGVVWLLLGIYCSVTYDKFTPVYRDVDCAMGPPAVSNFRIDGGYKLDVTATITCQNPNPYDLIVTSSEPGRVYATASRVDAGAIEPVPASTVPSEGTGNIIAQMSLALPSALSSSLPMLIMSGGIPMYFEVNLNVKIDARFLAGSFRTEVPFNKKCGVVMKIDFAMQMSAGPMSCSDAWDQVGGASGDTQSGSMAFGAQNVAGADVDQATQDKDLYLGIAQGVAYSLCAMFWAAALCAACRYRRRKLQSHVEA